MKLHRIKIALYALYLTNKFGFKLRGKHSADDVKKIRLQYAETLLSYLKISINVEDIDKINNAGPYLIVSNHRSIIDPLIIEIALKNSGINGLWIAKKELYNSFFFGMFTRNAGTVLLDREAKTMCPFFTEVKQKVKSGFSICVFAEGTRNKTEQTLAEFKEGAQIIAVKNRLPILPIFIETNANIALESSLKNTPADLTANIIVGDIIDYKDRSGTLQELYKSRFNLS
ncbi:lysophospholipid acyltransferase family protein [Psychromonas antarctica]|uniref:lysophospholipid acyltransferase family protein n=1 Tax=Psychromonas antarctica TaxID=67573 RepID=UPI001EE849AB|nr:lysophospholipid acyltransferase family protein [Psychromonas antarctica]MCG6202181.1 1-acyl-sn-glycerol-3-phosphate acyltransferase [Psychromonas antarctica]